MAKLLKHFGINYGNSKKSETFDFRAKTLPASTTDRSSMRVVSDTSKSAGRRNTGTVECTAESSHSSRRASHETFLTIPARGLRTQSERDWSSRDAKNRQPLQHAATLCGPRDSELTGSKKRRNSDTKDLRRCVTADEISSRNASSVTPALGDYSDPFDLKKVTAECKAEESASDAVLPLSEDDYSVPYEMKDRHKEVPVDIEETSHDVSTLTVADTTTAAKYDDPYEENPIAAKCLCNGVEEKLSEVIPIDVVRSDTSTSGVSTEQQMSRCTLTAVSDYKADVVCSAVPVRSFELSAEYAGFFVDPTPAVTEHCSDKAAQCHTDHQADTAQPPLLASAVRPALDKSTAAGAGLYDEPWDLSTVKHSIEAQLRESSQKDVGRTVVDSCTPATADVYAQPHKGEKSHHRIAASNTTDPGVTDPRVTNPRVNDPRFPDPRVTDPRITDPRATDSRFPDPRVTDPRVTEPRVTNPRVTDPRITDPRVTDPRVTDPRVTDPRVTDRRVTDPRVTDGPSYGVLCERLADNGFVAPPALARRQAGIRNNQPGTWTTDSRPVGDYDVPWDQKKKFVGQTTGDPVTPAFTVQPTTRMQATSSVMEFDIRLPLEQQT